MTPDAAAPTRHPLADEAMAGRGARPAPRACAPDPDDRARGRSRGQPGDARHLLGSEVFSLEHWFEPAGGGTRYRSRVELGADTAFGRLLFNRLLRPLLFSDSMGPAWLKHNVEEVGNFERFLPQLHARQAGP